MASTFAGEVAFHNRWIWFAVVLGAGNSHQPARRLAVVGSRGLDCTAVLVDRSMVQCWEFVLGGIVPEDIVPEDIALKDTRTFVRTAGARSRLGLVQARQCRNKVARPDDVDVVT